MTINTLLSLGIILLLGLVLGGLIRKIKMPSITAYLILGILIGPYFLGLISDKIISASGLISNVVLSFIAFSIGQNFSREIFREIGKDVIAITFGQGLGAALVVAAAIFFLTDKPFFVAISFGAIATATAPAAVVMVVREFRSKGKFTDTLLSVVALDDGIGLMFFALVLAVAKSIAGVHVNILPEAFSGILHGLIEIVGAVVLGLLLGWILSFFSKYVTSASELLICTLGFILLNAGLSLFLGFSLLLSNMAMAGMLVNISKTGFRFFDSIRSIDSPFYLLFFVLAGANLEIRLLKVIGLIGIIYIVARMFGKFMGVFLSAQIVGAPRKIRNYLGLGLAPQAGVALGMAMIIKNVFPKEGGFIMSTIIATTVIYEIFGPVLTKFALQSAGDIEK